MGKKIFELKDVQKIISENQYSECNLIDNSNTINYWQTMFLRWKKTCTSINGNIQTIELILQQMWQGSDGSQKWINVEEVD